MDMAQKNVADVLSTLKSYAQKISDGDRSPYEIASALNDWAHESAESLRAKIHEEVEAAVHKMGFVKREEFDALAKEVAALKGGKRKPAAKSAPKKAASPRTNTKSTTKKKSAVKKVSKR
jgi:BMFP domain-containing protein YqiC